MRRAVLMAVAVVLGAAMAWAEEPSATVTVTAERIPEAAQRAPTTFVTTIDTQEHADRMETTTDALADTAGVQVRRFGGLGAFSTISVRGSSANQVQIYLDGVPLSRARNETVNLGDLPLDSLERIDVYRGTTPIWFGTGAVAGVVNLVTKRPSETPSTEIAASYGSFDTRKVVASHSREIQGLDVLGYFTYLGSEGDFTFHDDNGTPLNPADDEITARRNNSFDSGEAVLKAGYAIRPDVRVDLTSETFVKDQGVPGTGSNQSRHASLDELRALNFLRLASTGIAGGAIQTTGTVFGIYERVNFTDLAGELGTGLQDRHDRTTVAGGNFEGSYFAPAIGGVTHTPSWFAELSREAFAPYNREQVPADEPDQRRWHLGISGQDEITVYDERLLLLPTWRYEHLDDSGTAFTRAGQAQGPRTTATHDLWSPAIGAHASVQPWLALKGNIGRFERAPNFGERFGNTGTVVGNPVLLPESSLNRDIGFEVRYRSTGPKLDLLMEYAYFNNDIDDLILFVELSPGVFKALNTAARIRGHEVSAQIGIGDHLRLLTNATLQDGRNLSAIGIYRDRRLPGRPADEYYLRVEALAAPGKVYYELNYISGNYLDQANYDRVRSRGIHTVGFELRPPGPLTLSFEARNVTDNQISDVGGFPLPGRAFFGTVRAKF